MIGAQALIGSLTGAGVDVCFMNPGTSEMQFVSALDRFPGCARSLPVRGRGDRRRRRVRADRRRPAATLLHLGPGLANGLANLHNAQGPHRPWSSWANTPPGTADSILRWRATPKGLRAPCPVGSTPAAPPATWPGTRCARWPRRRPGRSPPWCSRPTSPGAKAAPSPRPAPPLHAPHPHLSPAPPPPAPTSSPHLNLQVVDYGRLLSPRAMLLLGGTGPVRARPAGGQPDQRRDRRAAAGRDVPGADGARRRGARPSTGWPTWPSRPKPSWPGVDHLILAGARSPVSFFAYPGRASDLAPGHGHRPGRTATRTPRPRSRTLADQVAAGTSSRCSPRPRRRRRPSRGR